MHLDVVLERHARIRLNEAKVEKALRSLAAAAHNDRYHVRGVVRGQPVVEPAEGGVRYQVHVRLKKERVRDQVRARQHLAYVVDVLSRRAQAKGGGSIGGTWWFRSSRPHSPLSRTSRGRPSSYRS